MLALRTLAVSLLVILCMQAVAKETIKCTMKEKFRNGGSRDTELELSVENERVVSLSFSNGFSSGREGGGGACFFDASRTEPAQSVWNDSGDRIDIVVNDEKNDDRKSKLQIVKIKNGYQVNFMDMRTRYCGFAAEFPHTVQLVRGNAKCAAKY